MCVYDAFGQSLSLYGKYFFATLVQGFSLRNKWRRIETSAQLELFRNNQLRVDIACLFPVLLCHVCRKSSVHLTFHAQALHINFCADKLFLQREALTFGEQGAVFVDKAFTGKDKILGAFSETAAGEYIAGQAAGTLLCQQRFQILVLSDALIVGTQVENDFRSAQGSHTAWRNRCPNIFADFYRKAEVRQLEYKVVSQRNLLTADFYRGFRESGATGEPALLIKFFIVRQIGFGNQTQNLAFLDYGGTVQQSAAVG